MFSLIPKIMIGFFLAFSCSFSFANEDAHKEAKEGAAAAEAPKNKPSEESFTVIQARVAALEAKVHSGEAEIEKLVTEKHNAKDPEKVNEIIRQMINVHKEIEANAKEYDQQRALLKYRYPEKGLMEKREYERIDVKSLEEMENQMSIGSSLNRILKKVRSQYQVDAQEIHHEDKIEGASAVPKKESSPAKNKPNIVDPIILKK